MYDMCSFLIKNTVKGWYDFVLVLGYIPNGLIFRYFSFWHSIRIHCMYGIYVYIAIERPHCDEFSQSLVALIDQRVCNPFDRCSNLDLIYIYITVIFAHFFFIMCIVNGYKRLLLAMCVLIKNTSTSKRCVWIENTDGIGYLFIHYQLYWSAAKQHIASIFHK